VDVDREGDVRRCASPLDHPRNPFPLEWITPFVEEDIGTAAIDGAHLAHRARGSMKYIGRKLRKDGTLDVAVMAHELTQSLVVIMDQDEAPKS
jgi:hypothetical protein